MVNKFLFSGWKTALVAGDSNVHRINSVAKNGDLTIKCLPVSGARYTNDKKMFRSKLKACVREVTYERLYLYLGSNDVLSQEHLFYRNVTEVCDMIHEASPGTEIVLCEIPPRAPSQSKTTNIPGEKLKMMQKWIEKANNIMKNISFWKPYVKFLGSFLSVHHLTWDGLHLSLEGAEVCYRTIATDNSAQMCCTSPVFEEEDWPVLGDVKMEEKACSTPSYADIVRTESKLKRSVQAEGPVEPKHTQKARKKKTLYIQCRQWLKRQSAESRHQHGCKKRLKKKFAGNVCLRSVKQWQEYVVVNLTDDVAVEIPACKIPAPFLKTGNKPIAASKCTPKARCLKDQRKRFRRQQTWLPCPECRVRCSREDFLLEHVIKHHVKEPELFLKESVPVVKNYRIQASSRLTGDSTPNDTHCTRKDEEESINQPAQESIGKNVNTSALKLLLSNDVEKNPGPTMHCKWNKCAESFATSGECNAHVVAHVGAEKVCRWEGCPGYTNENLILLEMHSIRHVYDNKDLFPTMQIWLEDLPGRKVDEKTNLNYCPKHIRSELKLLLFDEDFEISENTYTTLDHRKYLEFLYLHYPTQFQEREKKFVSKRMSLGEDWSTYMGQNTLDRKAASTSFHSDNLNLPRNFYCVQAKPLYDLVQTTRPELSSNFFSGTELKPRKLAKRKFSDAHALNVEDSTVPWFKVILSNLKVCLKAINIQKDILNKMHEIGIIESTNQTFFMIEEQAAKLASLENCTAGVFVCFVFKCIINEEEIFYVRYLESGCFSGFLHQNLMGTFRDKYNVTDSNCLLHCVYTSEDLEDMRQIANNKTVQRHRPDKIRNNTISKILTPNLNSIKKTPGFTETSDVGLESYIVNIWPYKPDSSADRPETPFLEVSNPTFHADLKKQFVDFRIHKVEFPALTSRDIFENEIPSSNLPLLQQSEKLNCLSNNIKRTQSKHLYKRPARYEANFLNSQNKTSSLRNHMLVLFLKNDFKNLYSFLLKYFPGLGNYGPEHLEPPVPEEGPSAKKVKRDNCIKSLKLDKSILENRLRKEVSSSKTVKDGDPISLFDTFCFQLVQHGKLSIQSADESGDLMCIMNDYSATDGSFREADFVYTSKLVQEKGNYFYCSCKTYTTLLGFRESQCSNDFVVLDSSGENFVTCMHCKFLSQFVVPYLDSNLFKCNTPVNNLIQNALKDNGKELVELIRKKNTRKYSILAEGEGQPTFVHVTFSLSFGKYIVSCLNGQCLSKKGHKRNINTLEHVTVCKHLTVLRNHFENWQDLKNSEPLNIDIELESQSDDNENGMICLDNLAQLEDNSNFDENTGLWNFKCKSSHKPSGKDSESLKLNLKKRDLWNDNNLKRDKDGCLIGPTLFPDIPDNTCDCGAGWLKRDDDENYSENGRTINENSRLLTIFTSFAPVKCQIHNRICYNDSNPCKILWDEGSLDSLHVLSRDTAAGDEIGWEFVSMVMNSGCTFSAYTKLKNELYQIRDCRAKFMDSTVFLSWWFSWAASMKIDFRQSCDVCGFEPKRLCCDGTKVGVGFRHARFVEIEKVISDTPEIPTLHRRMDRCFLKNSAEITVPQMIKNREFLNYLARESLGELKEKEILTPEDRQDKIFEVRQALPRDFLYSFDKFFPFDSISDMHESEQIAFAYLLKMLATTASVTSLLPPKYCSELKHLLEPHTDDATFNHIMNNMRCYAPELRDLIAESLNANSSIDGKLEDYMNSLLRCLISESLSLQGYESEAAVPQPGTYNPAKYGRAYYFNKYGLKLRNMRKFSIDSKKASQGNDDHDDAAQDFEKCQKMFSKSHISARGTTNLFLWFCADHGHCYGFHMTYAEGRKDPSASLYSYLETPPTDVFYDFACNLQEYCLNRESGYYKDVRFFHDIFHGYSHKCSCAFRSSRLQGLESVNSEICEQFNSFLQNIKKSARQMTQEHFCFYLQFFLHQWNSRKRDMYQKKIKVALAGLH